MNLWSRIPWKLRRPIVSLNRWVLWFQQGRPTDGPVVLAQGELARCPTCGHRWICNWWWHGRFMKRQISGDELWDFLSARYEVETRYCGPDCISVRSEK